MKIQYENQWKEMWWIFQEDEEDVRAVMVTAMMLPEMSIQMSRSTMGESFLTETKTLWSVLVFRDWKEI